MEIPVRGLVAFSAFVRIEVRLTHASHQREPRSRLEFVLEPDFREGTVYALSIREIRSASVIEQHAEQLIVTLPEAVDPRIRGVPSDCSAQRHLPPGIR